MARFTVFSKPGDPRQGVFAVDAPNEKIAQKRIDAGGGDIVWSTNTPRLNEELLNSFGPLTKERTRKHIDKLMGEFSTSGSVMLDESLGTRAMKGAVDLGKKSALPVGGSIAGGVLAPFAGVPSPIGAAAGGGLGEVANQVLGVTPPDFEQILLATGVGGAGKTTANILPKVGPRVDVSKVAQKIPGAGGAFTEMAGEQLRSAPAKIEMQTHVILGNETIDSLFDLALQSRPRKMVPTPNLRSMLASGLMTERNAKRLGWEFPALMERLRKTSRQTTVGGKALTINDLDVVRRRVGARTKGLLVDGEERNTLRSLYKGIMNDLEVSAAREPEAAALLTGIKVARREFAARDLGDFLEQRIFGLPRRDGIQPIQISRLKKEFDQMLAGRPSKTFELFEGSLSRMELEDIREVIDFWAENLPILPPPAGVQFGSGPTAAAGALGYVVGGGAGASAAVIGKQLLTRGLMSKRGRAALLSLISEKQPINLMELAAQMVGTAARQSIQSPKLLERFQGQKIESER